jgi:hypothetical protein
MEHLEREEEEEERRKDQKARMNQQKLRKDMDKPPSPFLFKGTVPQNFEFKFFSWISFPQVAEYPQRSIVNFFKNSQRYLQLNLHYRCH